MAKKELKVQPYLAPMPVLMIATYGENDKVDVMNMAWGGICDSDKVALNIGADHKTSENIRARKAFTISVADVPHMAESDFFGIATGNKMDDKFEHTGMHAVRSAKVDAPIIEEYPLTLECEVIIDDEDSGWHRVIGKIVGVLCDEDKLDEKGRPDFAKLNLFAFDQFSSGYYAMGEKVGQAWNAGAGLMKG